MISYSDLIYHFTDIYLETAMECSICKENYTMADDNKFLDDFMKFFSSLILIIDNDERLDVSQLKEALTEKKEETLTAFHLFLKRQIAQEAIEYADLQMQRLCTLEKSVKSQYLVTVERYMDYIFDKTSEKLANEPARLLKHIRENEEMIKKEWGIENEGNTGK